MHKYANTITLLSAVEETTWGCITRRGNGVLGGSRESEECEGLQGWFPGDEFVTAWIAPFFPFSHLDGLRNN